MVTRQNFISPMPLAARMRPESLDEVLGQKNALGEGSPLRRMIENIDGGSISVILYGPPGVGKTTLARLIANARGSSFRSLSAITAGVKEVREVIEEAQKNSTLFAKQTVLFLDEIHRFSKSQQDSLLPSVESGAIVLVAATTENPAFSVIQPLLSRSITIALSELADDEIRALVMRAIEDPRGFDAQATIEGDALGAIVSRSGGDARRALTSLEASAATAFERQPDAKSVLISIEDVDSSTSRAANIYDRSGDGHYDTISAFIKSVRGSDVDAALYYLARMIDGGEDPRFIARRLIILASEDVGLADPAALSMAVSAAEAVSLIGMPEGRIPLSQATIYLALAPKSNTAYKAINKALEVLRGSGAKPVPMHLRGTGFSSASAQGRGVDYQYPHDSESGVLPQQYLPDGYQELELYEPKSVGKESELALLWKRLRAIIRRK